MVAVSRTMVTLDRVAVEGNADDLAVLFAEDAVIMLPGEATLLGRRAIRARAATLVQDRPFQTRHEPLEIDAAGPYLIHRGLVHVSVPRSPRDTISPLKLRYLYVLKRVDEDSLLIWRAILNRATD